MLLCPRISCCCCCCRCHWVLLLLLTNQRLSAFQHCTLSGFCCVALSNGARLEDFSKKNEIEIKIKRSSENWISLIVWETREIEISLHTYTLNRKTAIVRSDISGATIWCSPDRFHMIIIRYHIQLYYRELNWPMNTPRSIKILLIVTF